eukprot:6174795-Amphidinium_carterae.1
MMLTSRTFMSILMLKSTVACCERPFLLGTDTARPAILEVEQTAYHVSSNVYVCKRRGRGELRRG